MKSFLLSVKFNITFVEIITTRKKNNNAVVLISLINYQCFSAQDCKLQFHAEKKPMYSRTLFFHLAISFSFFFSVLSLSKFLWLFSCGNTVHDNTLRLYKIHWKQGPMITNLLEYFEMRWIYIVLLHREMFVEW